MPNGDLPANAGSVLLPIARAAIAREFGGDEPVDASADWLQKPGASFVTITEDGRLRGCLGTLEARRSLLEDVRGNAAAVASRDRRFEPLQAEDLDRVRIEVTVLSPMEDLPADSEADALSQLRPGIDGVVFECDGHRSTYLPQVWHTLPDPQAFMASLKAKAGFPTSFWSDDVQLRRYTATSWYEPERG